MLASSNCGNPLQGIERKRMAERSGWGRGLRVLAVANQKGGVGKTTTAINLGTALAAVGRPVVIVDLDPQGNASTGLGIGKGADDRSPSTLDVLMDRASLAEAVKPTGIPLLSIVPATGDLMAIEREVAAGQHRVYPLRNALIEYAAHQQANARGEAKTTYVLIDCPPSLNVLTINALSAADAVLVPLQCEFFAMEGLAQLVRTINDVRERLNPALAIQGVVLTMHDKRNRLTHEVEENVREALGEKVYSTFIPRNVRVAEAPSFGKPILLYDHLCEGSRAYIELASEVIKREQQLAA